MQTMIDDLPKPTPEALALSTQLQALIQDKIRVKGYIPFSEFFNLCLYAPNLGYYENDLRKFGAEGDFVTAPELSPFFSYALANQIIEIISPLQQANILEIGAGSGKMAADIISHLKKQDCLPQKYQILERSLSLKQRQKEYLQTIHPDYFAQIEWIETPPTQAWQGILIANEVIDALAVERFCIQYGEAKLLQVIEQEGKFAYQTAPANASLRTFIEQLAQENIHFEEDYVSEYCPQLTSWLAAVSENLQTGACLFIDYGYPRQEYYHPLRKTGNMLAHYRHHAHEDFFLYPGLQDLTANVDFTALGEAALANNFEVAGYSNQMYFLYGCHLEHLLQEVHDQSSYADWLKIAQNIQRLVLPNEMGERFQAMLMTRNLEQTDFIGFSLRDLRNRL